MLSLEEVQKYISKMSNKISVSKGSDLLPMFSKTEDVFSEGESIYIDDKYHYIIMERGQMYKHYESEELEDILYPLFKNITFSLAQEYELNHRRANEDFRRLMWRKQLKLLGKINKDFAEMRKKEIEEILKKAPYNDAIECY